MGSSTTISIPEGRPAPVATGAMAGAGMEAEELTAAVGEGRAALALLVTFIHRSAWNRYSRKFGCTILHSPAPIDTGSPL